MGQHRGAQSRGYRWRCHHFAPRRLHSSVQHIVFRLFMAPGAMGLVSPVAAPMRWRRGPLSDRGRVRCFGSGTLERCVRVGHHCPRRNSDVGTGTLSFSLSPVLRGLFALLIAIVTLAIELWSARARFGVQGVVHDRRAFIGLSSASIRRHRAAFLWVRRVRAGLVFVVLRPANGCSPGDICPAQPRAPTELKSKRRPYPPPPPGRGGEQRRNSPLGSPSIVSRRLRRALGRSQAPRLPCGAPLERHFERRQLRYCP